jgi:transposase
VLCGGLGLFGGELVAIDGTFLPAVNSPARNFTKAKVEKILEAIDARTERYLETLEQADREAPAQALAGSTEAETAAAKAAHLRAQIEKLQEQRHTHAEILEQLSAAPSTQLSLTDADSRSLQKGHERVIGYNAQIAVDARQHLMVVEEVTCEPNDNQMLERMAVAARTALGVERLEVVADRSYYDIDQLQRCAAAGITASVPAPRAARVAGDGTYPTEDFRYAAESDQFICPQGRALRRHEDTTKTSGRYRVYYELSACRDCPACTRGAYRKITVQGLHRKSDALKRRSRTVVNSHTVSRCSVPKRDGARRENMPSPESLWDKYFTAAPDGGGASGNPS